METPSDAEAAADRIIAALAGHGVHLEPNSKLAMVKIIDEVIEEVTDRIDEIYLNYSRESL